MDPLTPILAWLGLIPLMITNGIVRESFYGKTLDELRSHQLSTLTGIMLLLIYTFLVFPWLGIESVHHALKVGGLWVLLTVLFEFAFGHFIAGHSWKRLFFDYNLLAGRVWIVFLIALGLAPWTVVLLRG